MPRAPKTTTATKKPRDTYIWPQGKIDELISEASNLENIRTLLGKQEAGEARFFIIYCNTSGDSKVKVYGRIAAKLFPSEYASDPKPWKRRVQHKWDYLGAQYRAAAKRLRQTGEGLKPDPNLENDDTASLGIAEIELLHYIPPDGPDHDTPTVVRNIWDDITQKFPQFPRMHELLSTRPNQVPIAITTALTPSGPVMILHQPPSDSEDGEDTEGTRTNSQSLSDLTTPGLELAPVDSRSGRRTVARPSTRIQAAHRVSNNGSGSGHRRLGIEERFLEIQKQIQARIFERDKHAQKLAERELVLKEKQQLLEEFKLGLVTPNEYRQAAARLEGNDSYSGGTPLLPDTPQPSQVEVGSSAAFSPDWGVSGLPVESELASLSLS